MGARVLGLFYFRQIERAGRWVNTGDRDIDWTPGVHNGGNGHFHGGLDRDSALRFLGVHLFTPPVRFCHTGWDRNSLG
jgi:hypothetical protein